MQISPRFNRLSITLGLCLVLCLPATAQAQSDSGVRITTSPSSVSLTTEPGQTVSTKIKIRNDSNQPETFKVDLLKFSADNQTGQAKLIKPDPHDEFIKWVSFSSNKFKLQPNQWQTITMTINTPKTAAFGYYYAPTFTTVTDDAQTTQQASIIGASATLVLLEVESPNAKRQLSLTDFQSQSGWYEYLPAKFTATLRNTGNVHSVARGNIFIRKSGSDQIVDTLEVNQQLGNILPDSQREFTSQWSNGFPHYTFNSDHQKQELTWDFSQLNHFRLGKYQAQLVMAYDNGFQDVPLEATIDFWIIPWKIILSGLAILTLCLLGLYFTSRSLWSAIHRKTI